MSTIMTSSGCTCPSHQESAWGAAEARQERVIVEVVRNGIVPGQCWIMCWTHLQMFCISAVLRHGAVLRSICKAPGRRPPPRWIGRGQINKGIMLGELRVLLFLCFRIVLDWMGMDVWANVFAVPFLCAITSLGTMCPSHHESALRDICQASWRLPTTTLDRKRTTNRRLKGVWWVEGFALCCFRSVHRWMGYCGSC